MATNDPSGTGPTGSTSPIPPPQGLSTTPRIGEQPGDWVGPYKLLSVIGEGGFGTVWLAERREPIVHRVALKLLLPGMHTKEVLARFEQERQALAVMSHPNVAKVLDAGATAQGLPYFVMEHVPGEAITVYCDRQRLTVRQRLELFIPVCEAVQHAHHKGIIHRDIKPNNILVAVHDGQAIPKVIDFGVAKAVSHTLTEKTIFTEQGRLIGTPEYMSPEQAEMGATDIDTRTDVYSLGATLYEILSGALPFDSKKLRSKGFAEIQRVIREEVPLRPSTRFTMVEGEAGVEIAAHRQTVQAELVRELKRELDWLPMKALRKDRRERYATVSELANDIRRYLRDEPLAAGPESVAYRFQKFVRRNRVACCWLLLACAVAAASSGLLMRQLNDRYSRANSSHVVLEDVNYRLGRYAGKFNAIPVLPPVSLHEAAQHPLVREAVDFYQTAFSSESHATNIVVGEHTEYARSWLSYLKHAEGASFPQVVYLLFNDPYADHDERVVRWQSASSFDAERALASWTPDQWKAGAAFVPLNINIAIESLKKANRQHTVTPEDAFEPSIDPVLGNQWYDARELIEAALSRYGEPQFEWRSARPDAWTIGEVLAITRASTDLERQVYPEYSARWAFKRWWWALFGSVTLAAMAASFAFGSTRWFLVAVIAAIPQSLHTGVILYLTVFYPPESLAPYISRLLAVVCLAPLLAYVVATRKWQLAIAFVLCMLIGVALAWLGARGDNSVAWPLYWLLQ